MLREQLVLLDVELADLYGVTPEQLGELVRQNRQIFSAEFAFSIEPDEIRNLKHGVAAVAFTEHGVILAATVLNSPHAVEISIHIVRAFVKLREATASDTEIAYRIAALEKSIARLDARTRERFEDLYRAIDKLIAPPAPNLRSDRGLH